MSRHLTEDQICRAIAGQSTLYEHRHAHECGECRAEIEQARQLLGAFRQGVVARAERDGLQSIPRPWLRHTDLPDTDRPDVGGRDIGRRRPSGLRTAGPVWVSAVALLMIASAAVWQLQSPDRLDSPRTVRNVPTAGQGGDMTDHTVDTGDEFYPLLYSSVPVTNGRIVRIEVPRSAPVAFGVDPISLVSSRRGDVLADVVVGEDGLARAVRFVRPVSASQTSSKE